MNKALTIAFVLLFAAGCNGALWGQVAVLAVTVGIFFSTLRLGKSETMQSRADQSTSTAGRS